MQTVPLWTLRSKRASRTAAGAQRAGWPIPTRYALTETPTNKYPQQTEWNVRDSDGTVVFSIQPVLRGGSKKTVQLAMKHEAWTEGVKQTSAFPLIDSVA